MFENTTGLEATGGKLSSWNLKPPNILPYLKIQQDFQPRGNIWIIEDTKYVTMFENTTRLQATGKSLSCWSHPMFAIFEGTTKLPATEKIQSIEATKKAMFNGEKFKLFNLKPPTRQCLKMPQNCRPRTKYFARFENTTRFPATGAFKSLKQPYMWQCLKIPQDCRPWSKIENIEASQNHQICGNVWKYHKMAGHGGKFNLLKQPNTWQCLKIPHDSRTQDCQQRKNIELIKNMKYVAMLKNSATFENTDERRKA